MNQDKYYVKITSKHNLFDLKFKEVWQYRQLVLLLTKRDFAIRYKQTILGPAWLFIRPLFTAVIYSIVFGNIANIGTEGIPKFVFYLAGYALWDFFSGCTYNNSQTFNYNVHLFSKVYFPRMVTSCATILTSALDFLIQMTVVLVFIVAYTLRGDIVPNFIMWGLLPFLILWLGIMGMGVGIIVSSLTTKYRDLSILFGFIMSLWMYGTPIVYPVSFLEPGILKNLILFNPVTSVVELFRFILLGSGSIESVYLLWSAFFTVMVALIGILTFNRVEKTFLDTI